MNLKRNINEESKRILETSQFIDREYKELDHEVEMLRNETEKIRKEQIDLFENLAEDTFTRMERDEKERQKLLSEILKKHTHRFNTNDVDYIKSMSVIEIRDLRKQLKDEYETNIFIKMFKFLMSD